MYDDAGGVAAWRMSFFSCPANLLNYCSAPEGIKRIFSVDLASKQTVNDICEKELVELVQRHPYDVDSLEYKSEFLQWSSIDFV